ncbi:alpha/beta fold hydrolase [Antrihabitans stalactiti]|uniref:alpha/beta fold hydrolase n=1 Tax=Antrihabitans stalactiti TaxID=2584121 RepID=UPI001F0D6984|nr:alpha/beta fold hydrolase [Antrihabitans stalactiti]
MNTQGMQSGRAGIRASAVGAVRTTVGSVMARRSPTQRNWRDELLRDSELDYEIIPVVTDDGATLHVRAYGPADAEPIVLCHGWSCRIEIWNPQINALAGRYRVIAYDQRGHGRSTLGKRTPSADVLGDDLATVLDASLRSRKKAVLVGHSMGGITLMAWASRHPDQVRRFASSLLLANTASGQLAQELNILSLGSLVPRIQSTVGKYVVGAPVAIPRGIVTRRAFHYVGLAPQADKEAVDFCHRIVLSCKARARGQWGWALATLDLTEAVEAMAVPTVVLTGEQDRLTPSVHSLRLAEALDRTGMLDKLVVLPGVGHMGNIEAVDAFNDEIVRLRSRRRRPRRLGAAG